MGSNVISGSATAVVVAVGDDTLFGSMAVSVAGEAVETNFTKGVNASFLGPDSLHAGDGTGGILHQWSDQG